MEAFLSKFKIRDLEEFSGVKAHTIRIWEKRYGLLTPHRTDTNIRNYGTDDLKAILNVAFLNNHGIKISRIAAMTVAERDKLVRETAETKDPTNDALNTLKLAAITFDEAMFNSVSAKFREQHGFRQLLEMIYIPLLRQVGVLWHANAICPAQEHFVSNIVRKELIVATDRLQLSDPTVGSATNVLLLPDNELHELGLLYLHYLFRSQGERTIYLGQSVPIADLHHVIPALEGPIRIVMCLTAEPTTGPISTYLNELRASLPDPRMEFILSGPPLKGLPRPKLPSGFSAYPGLTELLRDKFPVA